MGDQYDVQGMDSLSRLISKCIGTCNIGIGARGRGYRGQARQPPPNNFENGLSPPPQWCATGLRAGTGSVPYIYKRHATSFETETDIYADDTVTHTAGKKLEVVEPKLQISADDFNTWCIDNNMRVHYGKTHAFVVDSKHMTSANEGISVTINEHSIESVSAQKHLGITIDKNLTLEQQIDLVCRNVSCKLTLVKLLSKYVNQIL